MIISNKVKGNCPRCGSRIDDQPGKEVICYACGKTDCIVNNFSGMEIYVKEPESTKYIKVSHKPDFFCADVERK